MESFNGIVERKHRSLLSTARALMFQSGMPLRFWPYSILTTTWLINRLPSVVVEWKSPYEVLFGHPSDYAMLKPFGCLVYAANLSPHRGKFDSRSIKCVFIGYDVCHKGYLLFDMDNEKVFVSRDVKFILDSFPFLHKNNALIEQPALYFAVRDLIHMTKVTTNEDGSPPLQFQSSGRLSPSRPSTLPSPTTSDRAVQDPELRRGTRIRQPPVWMRDYIGSVQSTQLLTPPVNITPPTFPYMISPSLSKSHIHYPFNINLVQEPRSFKEAVQHPQWQEAIHAELQELTDNQTWIIIELPPSKRPIGCKWLLKVKLNADGSVERYKARLVAKGYTQEQGIDYQEVFSPVANLVTVRLFIVVTTAHCWHIHQLDVNNAFLHGHLTDEIYMTIPPGLDGYKIEQVCKLKKSLYGLKQASREWNAEFSKILTSLGYSASLADPCLFTKGYGPSVVALLVYVDDVIITGPSLDILHHTKCALHSAFIIKSSGVC